jgi:hypothetical protein
MKNTRRDFVKTTGFGALSFGLLPNLFPFNNGTTFLNQSLPRRSPESQGVPSKGILDFVNAVNASGIEWHSFMLLRHGNVIAEGWWKPFEPGFIHSLRSLSKSFTSTAIGFLVDEGKLSVEDQVISFFKDELPENPSDNLKAMKVKHLLTMNTGNDKAYNQNPNIYSWTKYFLENPVPHPPGTHFLYNNLATYMLGAIVHRLTGQRLDSFLAPRLFQPLGIKDYDWTTTPQGLNAASGGLRVKTEDIAKLGQLYLQKGKWKGQQILSEKWIEEATRKQTDNSNHSKTPDNIQGYGYQFWRSQPKGIYRGEGAYGQFCIVMPEQDVVLAATTQSWESQKSLTLIWETLLPIFTNKPLTENPTDTSALKNALNRLKLPVPKSSIQSSLSNRYHNQRFTMDKNPYGVIETLFLFSKQECTAVFLTDEGEVKLKFGWENWLLSKGLQNNLFPTANLTDKPSKIAGTATWLNDNTLRLTTKFVEVLSGDTYTCLFEDNKVTIAFLSNLSENVKTAPETRKPLIGNLMKPGN